MTKTGKIIAAIVVIVVIIWIIVASTGKKTDSVVVSKESIKIGFVGPLTGDAGNLGQNAKAGVEIAVAEINSAGGINGRPLEVIYEDGKCTGSVASSAANKLINIDKVTAILGGACSGETASFANMAEQSKITVLSYCSSAPSITTAGDYIFRNYPSDNFQGVVAADYVKNTLKKSKVAILHVKSDWGTGLKETFTKKFTELGGTVVDVEGYDDTNKDFRSAISKIKSSNPELVYFLGFAGHTAPALKQMKDLKLSVPLFGGDAWDDPKVISDSGKDAEGLMYLAVARNVTDSFKNAMSAKTSSDEIAGCTPTAYDGIKVYAQIIGKVGTDSTAIKDELYKTVYTGGISSKEISFDANGDLKNADYNVKVIKNGKTENLK